MIKRVMTLLNRRSAANQLGVLFQRSAAFRLPNAIRLNGRMHRVSLPAENGVKVAFIDILLDDCYGCRVLERKRETIRTVLDIGGNVGLFGIAARNVFPSARIHSYEPNQLLKPYLSVQAEAAQFDYFMEAVGVERGMISLALNEDSVQTRSVRDAEGRIPQVAFREAIQRIGGEVDLLKMDCEGDEWTLFRDKHSWRHVKHICMEYHLFNPGQTEQAVQATLKDLGFEITSFVPIRHFGLVTASRNT